MSQALPAPSPRALSEEEQSVVRETLNSPRFRDQAPREVYATLLDEERYLCSRRTMYRILEQNQEVQERRDQLRYPNHVKPELAPTAPKPLAMLLADLGVAKTHSRPRVSNDNPYSESQFIVFHCASSHLLGLRPFSRPFCVHQV
jgi:hypothetical protein